MRYHNYDIEIVSIEGNIGSGKSTLLANLKEHYAKSDKTGYTNFVFVKEPVDEWANIKDENGITILEKFYADQEKYSFSFQMMAYISRLNLIKEAVTNARNKMRKFYEKNKNYNVRLKTVIITERSLFTDKMVFAKMLYDSGKIEHVNYQIYLNWFNSFAKEFPIDKIIYVKSFPKTCYERVGIRHREGEDKIPLEYLKSCDEYHNNMMTSLSKEKVCDAQLVLDGNVNIYTNTNVLEEWIEQINQFINN